MKTILLSVIVPAYKAERSCRKDILNISEVLSQTPYTYEIIYVVDGTNYDSTYDIAKTLSNERIKVYGYTINKGKGQAVRYGMKKAKGDLVMYIDSGGDINPNGIMMLLEHMKWYNADIIVGSKFHPASKVNFNGRALTSYGYNLGVQLLFGKSLKVRDTQTGIKVFKKHVLEHVLERLVVKRYAFDIELLAVSHRLGFNKIYDAPVEVNFEKSESTISFKSFFKPNGIFRFIFDTLAVFYRLKILQYYDDYQNREKTFDPDLQMHVNTGDLNYSNKQKLIDLVNKVPDQITNLKVKLKEKQKKQLIKQNSNIEITYKNNESHNSVEEV